MAFNLNPRSWLSRQKVTPAIGGTPGQGGAGAQAFLQNPVLPWGSPSAVNPPGLIGSYQLTGTPMFVPVQAKAQLWDLTSQNWFQGFSVLTRPRNSATSG
jgi:hypothetical protein